MKNTLLVALSFFALCIGFGCSKNSVEPQKEYHPLAVGNYWIYTWTEKDTNGLVTDYNTIDTVRIIGDTLYNNALYYISDYTYLGIRHVDLVRDSSGYLVTRNGRKLMHNFAFLDTLHTRHYGDAHALEQWSIQLSGEYAFSTDFGNYQCKKVESSHIFEIMKHPENPRKSIVYYAPEIGDVYHSAYFLGSTSLLEARLVDYHIK